MWYDWSSFGILSGLRIAVIDPDFYL